MGKKKLIFLFIGILILAVAGIWSVPYVKYLQMKKMIATVTVTRTFKGHEHWVRSIVFHPTRDLLVTGSYDKTIKLWDLSTGKDIKTLFGHTSQIRSIAFSQDGSKLISVAGEGKDSTAHGEIFIWDLNRAEPLQIIEEPAVVYSLISHPHKPIFLTGGGDHDIKVWDSDNYQVIKTLSGHVSSVRSLAFSPDGALLASGSDSASHSLIKLWNFETGEVISTLSGNKGQSFALAFSPDGGLLANGYGIWKGNERKLDYGGIELWNVSSGQLEKTLNSQPASGVVSVTFSPKGRLLVAGDMNMSIELWDVKTGKMFRTLEAHSNWVGSVVFTPDGSTLVSGSAFIIEERKSGEIKFWGDFSGF